MIESERELFVRRLRELYTIERELEAIQSAMAEDATDEELADFFASHAEATTDQLERLDAIFEGLDADYEHRESETLEALRGERDQLVSDVPDPNLADRVTAETGRAIERLEITKLETLLTLSSRLDLPTEVTDPLRTTKTEAEGAVDRLEALSAG